MDCEKLKDYIDSQIKELGIRIADYQNEKIKISELEKRIDSLHGYLVLESKNFELKNKEKESSFSEIKNMLDSDRISIGSIYSELKSISNKILKNEDSINFNQNISFKNSSKINITELEINSLKESAERINKSLSELSSIIPEISNIVLMTENKLCEHEKRFPLLEKEIANIKSFVCSLEHSLAISNQKISDILDIIRKDSDRVSGIREEIISCVQKIVSESIKNIKIPSVDNLISREEFSKLCRDVEISSLDSKNSLLRSQNNEGLCQIISKKLESLQIELKRIEISQ